MAREETKKRFKSWCQAHIGNNASNEDCHMFNNIMALLEQEPCEDAISRRAVIDTLDTAEKFLDEDRTVERYKDILTEAYEVLPPVNPQEPKTGHWISDGYKTEADWIRGRKTYKCPFCGYSDNYSNRSNYCPNCGKKLESEE